MIISEKIFYLLDQKGITQKDFAVQTGISQSTISDWKRKKTNPSADKILKICEILHSSFFILSSSDHVCSINQSSPRNLASFSISNKRSKLVLVSFCTLPFCNHISHPAVNIQTCSAAFFRIFSCCLKCQFHKKSGTNREHCL